MRLKNISLKNFISFGNNENSFKFNLDNGELILLYARNASGKSSFKSSIDYGLYGKVRGKKKKYLPNETLINRFNGGDMRVELDFDNENDSFKIIRTNKTLNFLINGEEYGKTGKLNVQSKIEDYLDLDIETFNSFVSLSINDFKNFLSLTSEEKRLLLDKLFNLEIINEIGKVIKEKKKQNKHLIELLNKEISTYESSVFSFKLSLENIKKLNEINNTKNKTELIELINSKKDEFSILKSKLDRGLETEIILKNTIKESSKKLQEVTYQIRENYTKINLYNLGKCPTCSSDLSDVDHISHKNDLIAIVDKLTILKTEIETEVSKYENNNVKLLKINRETQGSFSELKSILINWKTQLNNLDSKPSMEKTSIDEVILSIDKIDLKIKESSNKLGGVEKKDILIDKLVKMFSDDGIKKSIISKIVKPLNVYIKDNLEQIGLNFNIELDDEFNACICQLGEEIETDSLSTGELKMANMCVMIAYLKLIRNKKYINFLFLDEVFSSIDIDNIYLVLELVKSFAKENNITVFLVHHAPLEKSFFDRVIKVEKDITSNLIEEF